MRVMRLQEDRLVNLNIAKSKSYLERCIDQHVETANELLKLAQEHVDIANRLRKAG